MSIINKDNLAKIFTTPIIIAMAVILSPLLLIMGLHTLVNGIWLNYNFRKKWSAQNKNILFIYSESPSWENYIKENIIPKIEDKSVVLNWSKRSEWKNNEPLEAKVFHHWGRDREFNPMAIIFKPKRKIQVIRFYKAFKELKRGKNTLLKEKEIELYSHLN